MNYEKAYKEALNKAKSKIENDKGHVLYEDDIVEIFPELAESKDERIRKELIEYFRWNSQGQLLNDFSNREVFAWFEKQGEQKITNSKENTDFTIYYPLKNGNGKYECIPYSFYGSLTSFSDNEDLIDFLRNCFYTKQKCEDWIEKQGKKDSQDILPTFTFDDILALQCCMQAMSKNDELYKKLQSIHDRLHEVYGLKKQDEQRPSWSEKDEKFIVDIMNILYRAKNQYAQTARLEECIDWLKSLKYRIKGE